MNRYVWDENGSIEPEAVRRLSRDLDIPTPAARFLVSRSYITPQDARAYLHADGETVHDPFLFANMERAVSSIGKAIDAKSRILIHGDYDVDGICGTALLFEYLHGQVPHVFRFLPDRRRDGYGVAVRAVDWAIENHIGLFIAVDCGTSDGDELSRLEAAGVTVVICDHHELPVDTPVTGTLLNPVPDGAGYPFRGLCGTGVAFKLIKALESRGIRGSVEADSLLDLYALATIADLAPLVEENRRLVREGITLINRDKRLGIKSLRQAARLEAPDIGSSQIGFMLAPRLNAPGRIANPKPALEVLCEKDAARSARLASILEENNARRRQLTDRVRDEVIDKILRLDDWRDRGGFILAGKNWDEGVLGIAAARVVEEFGKPALLISLDADTAKGSGRSVPGLHLKKQLDRCRTHLKRYGGHAQAVGFSIEHSQINRFTEELSQCLREATVSLPKQPVLKIDSELAIGECSLELLDFLGRCEPFGLGNKNPVWKVPRVTVSPDTRMVGGSHLKLFISDGGGDTAEAISFGWGRRSVSAQELHGRTVDMAVVLRRGYYLNREYAEIHVLDMRETGV